MSMQEIAKKMADDFQSEILRFADQKKTRRVYVAKWIASGNGEVKDIIDVAMTLCTYPDGLENTEVRNGIKVRKWDDTDWHEPDVQYMGIE